MNNVINKFLLAGNTFIPEMHLRQPGFTYSSCGLLTKNKTIQKFKATGDCTYIYRNNPDKTCFQHDLAYRDFKDLPRSPGSDIKLHDKASEIAGNP